MAGGTGGGISFLAWRVAQALRERAGVCTGWALPTAWRGRLVPPKGLRWRLVNFPVCAAGAQAPGMLPLRTCTAPSPGLAVMQPVRPARGGGPGRLHHLPRRHDGHRVTRQALVLHEQNSVAFWPGQQKACWRRSPTCVLGASRRLATAPVGGRPLVHAIPVPSPPGATLPHAAGALKAAPVVGGSLGQGAQTVVPRALARYRAGSAPWSRTKAAKADRRTARQPCRRGCAGQRRRSSRTPAQALPMPTW